MYILFFFFFHTHTSGGLLLLLFSRFFNKEYSKTQNKTKRDIVYKNEIW